ADRHQARRGTHRTRVVNRSEIERARFTIVCIDNRDTGVAQRGVDGKHTHNQLAIAPKARKMQPTAPKSKLTIQNLLFFVSAEMAAMAMAIWNVATPRAKTSCRWKSVLASACLCSASDLISSCSFSYRSAFARSDSLGAFASEILASSTEALMLFD